MLKFTVFIDTNWPLNSVLSALIQIELSFVSIQTTLSATNSSCKAGGQRRLETLMSSSLEHLCRKFVNVFIKRIKSSYIMLQKNRRDKYLNRNQHDSILITLRSTWWLIHVGKSWHFLLKSMIRLHFKAMQLYQLAMSLTHSKRIK